LISLLKQRKLGCVIYFTAIRADQVDVLFCTAKSILKSDSYWNRLVGGLCYS